MNPRRGRKSKRRTKSRRNPRRLKLRGKSRRSARRGKRNPKRGFKFKGKRGYRRGKSSVKAHSRGVFRRSKARKNPRRKRSLTLRQWRRRGKLKGRRNPSARAQRYNRWYRAQQSGGDPQTRNNPRRRKSRRRAPRRNPRMLTSRGLRSFRRNPKRGRRRAPRVRFMRNPRHRRGRGRRGYRRNPAGALTRPLQGIARKIPLVGGPLAGILGIFPVAALGAVAVELPLRGAQAILGMGWVPEFAKKEPVYLAITGSILGALAGKFSPKMKSELQLSITAASLGAAFYSWRLTQIANEQGIPTPQQVAQAETASDPSASTEGLGKLLAGGRPLGALSVGQQSLGMGPAYSVGPQGFGAVLIGS